MTSSLPNAERRFEAIVERVYEPLQRYAQRRCAHAIADDVVADALLVIWRRLDDVPDDAVLPWCYRVAANCLANIRRAEHRRANLLEKVARVDWSTARAHPDLPDADLPDPAMHAALTSLSDRDQEVLRLWAWEALSPAEIAVVLETSANAASIRLHRAKRRLGAALGKVPASAGHLLHDDTEEVT